ncbi:hypothetical protein [Janthinobacterium sp.]|uniref:hypothetical protein n=1 Tax=Janthinobacterium sp. TaxID=1871054 RepID=UPI00293D9BAF|nr:hypothetical protein [Janthinobacterium sp.]
MPLQREFVVFQATVAEKCYAQFRLQNIAELSTLHLKKDQKPETKIQATVHALTVFVAPGLPKTVEEKSIAMKEQARAVCILAGQFQKKNRAPNHANKRNVGL